MDYDQTAAAAVYDRARGYSPNAERLWRDVINGSVADLEIRTVLDLGCGTGRYSGRLATWLAADVIGVDPSSTMLERARAKAEPRVRFQQGPAEAIPLPADSVDLIFISMALHHFEDTALAVHECARVLRPGGRLCLRAGTTDRMADYPYRPFFPAAEAIWAAKLMSVERTSACFATTGLVQVEHRVIDSPVAVDWAEFAQKVGLRADSTLVQLDDADFVHGLTALQAFAAGSEAAGPVTEAIDYFVFRQGDPDAPHPCLDERDFTL